MLEGMIARQELSRVLDYTEGNQKLKLLNLIRIFRRPGFDTPQFKAALAEFNATQVVEELQEA